MEPPGGVEALLAPLRLLLALLALCLALLLLLGWRLARPRGVGGRRGPPPASPPLLQVLPSAAAARPGRREPLGAGAAPCSRGGGSCGGLQRAPVPAPPNSPASSAASRGTLGQGFSSCHTSTQRKLRSCSRTAWPPHLPSAPFEYGSSIQRHDERTGLNSANFTASQGPGLDSNFGASAGISVCILSSDTEESPHAAQLHPTPLGQFEWDYYDPGYKRSLHLPQQLPQICSKQYWL